MPQNTHDREFLDERSSHCDTNHASRTSTANDLIRELNDKHARRSGEEITFESLRELLKFIDASIGIKVSNGDQPLPIDTIRTIKLLFLANERDGRHMYRLLAPPGSKPTMEFSTATTVSRDSKASELIASLIHSLSKEVDPTRLERLSELLGAEEFKTTAEKLVILAGRTSDHVERILTSSLGGDGQLLAEAYEELADDLESIGFQEREHPHHSASEAMLMYLETLAFRHFVLHYPQHLKATLVATALGASPKVLEAYCKSIRIEERLRPNPYVKSFSVNSFHHLVLCSPKEITAAVRAATSLNGRSDSIIKNTARAKALLMTYAYRSLNISDPDDPILSVCDIVSALCSFHYQQRTGGPYEPYWHGQKTQGSDPQRHFDKGLRKQHPHQHQGVAQIYLNRFYEYRAAFSGTTQSYHSWMEYQVSRLSAYMHASKTNDISTFIDGIHRVDALGIDHAHEIAIRNARGRQEH